MTGVVCKSFDTPDEIRTPDKTTVAVVDLGDHKAARMTFEPGWKWSESIKPIAKTDSCQVSHTGIAHQGRLHVVHDDGTEVDIEAGQPYRIAPGHDAWVIGDEAFVGFEFETVAAATFAKA